MSPTEADIRESLRQLEAVLRARTAARVVCPACGGRHAARNDAAGLWRCADCGHGWPCD